MTSVNARLCSYFFIIAIGKAASNVAPYSGMVRSRKIIEIKS